MNSLDDVVKSGKVLYLGISDTPAWWVAAANTYARAHGKNQFVVYQGKWNVMRWVIQHAIRPGLTRGSRDFERDILPMAKHFGMALAPWDVLGGGKLQSKKQVSVVPSLASCLLVHLNHLVTPFFSIFSLTLLLATPSILFEANRTPLSAHSHSHPYRR
jgi:hypothetical protein